MGGELLFENRDVIRGRGTNTGPHMFGNLKLLPFFNILRHYIRKIRTQWHPNIVVYLLLGAYVTLNENSFQWGFRLRFFVAILTGNLKNKKKNNIFSDKKASRKKQGTGCSI